MPGGDATGPAGMGPMTGRGLGFCNPYGYCDFCEYPWDYCPGFGYGWGHGPCYPHGYYDFYECPYAYGPGFGYGRGRGLKKE